MINKDVPAPLCHGPNPRSCLFTVFLVSLALFLPVSGIAADTAEFQTVTVRPGDTLWSIANFYLKDPTSWNEILKYNRLPSSDPSVALPGMVLRVPVNMIKEKLRAARLIYFMNEVLFRKSETPDWKRVALNMDLYQDDSLRTTAQAQARVRFYGGEVLNIYSDSLAVLRPPKKQTDIELLKGEVRGMHSRVLTASARITPKTNDTDFSARVKEDLTTLVQVYKGRADVEAQGKTVEIPAGYASEVILDMAPSNPMKLPPLPETAKGLAPDKGPSVDFNGTMMSLKGVKTAGGLSVEPLSSGVGAGKNKTLSVGNPIQGYHVQVSNAQSFSDIALDRRYSAFETLDLKDAVPPGTYWVRISLIDLLGLEGRFTRPRQINVAAVPPKMELFTPKPGEKVYEQVLVVEGSADANSQVTVNGVQAVSDDKGLFSASVRLNEGENTVVVRAVGPHGLANEARRTVSYAKSRDQQNEYEPLPLTMWEEFRQFAGSGIGITILVGGVVIVTMVLLVLGVI